MWRWTGWQYSGDWKDRTPHWSILPGVPVTAHCGELPERSPAWDGVRVVVFQGGTTSILTARVNKIYMRKWELICGSQRHKVSQDGVDWIKLYILFLLPSGRREGIYVSWHSSLVAIYIQNRELVKSPMKLTFGEVRAESSLSQETEWRSWFINITLLGRKILRGEIVFSWGNNVAVLMTSMVHISVNIKVMGFRIRTNVW
jgi:hypothetical protein